MKTGLIFYLRSIALLVLLQAFYLTGAAQELIGYNYSNYNGVNSIISNPASIADSRYKVHFNLFTINAYGGNNGYEFNSNQVFKFQFSNWTEGNGYRKILKNDLKNGWFNADILGPSLLLNLNKRTAVGFTTRLRMLANVYNVSNNILGLMGNSNTSLYGMDFNERNIKINAASFADIGITLAKVLKDQGKSLIKGGITLKYIQGISSVYVQADNININIKDINSIQKLNGSVSVVYPQSLDQVTGNGGNKLNNEINSSNRTIGMDLGLVYEVRSGKFIPKDGNPTSEFKTIPYDIRFSISVTDFAFSPVRFKPGNESAHYTLSADNVKVDTFNVKNGQSIDQYFQHLQLGNLLGKQAVNGEYSMPLPTSIHSNVDWHITRHFFLNADALISLRGAKSQKNGSNYISTLSFTPRLETKWLNLFSPLSVNVQNEFNWGAGFRLGPLFAGSGSLLSNLLKENLRNLDAYVGLSIPIYQGHHIKKKKERTPKEEKPSPKEEKIEVPEIKDRDKDGVPDDKDACPDMAGPVMFNGCPDSDKDGIPDNKDQCPAIAGTEKYNGCPVPDADKDGVPDEEDKCPYQAGPVENYGCPVIKTEVKKTVDKTARELFFEYGKAIIDIHSYPALDKLVDVMETDHNLLLDIEGHTDNIGSDERNKALSLRRAEAAKQYLINKGISESRISTIAFGASKPIASNETEEGRRKNRRIVLKIRNY